jgi:hypothetical protein
METEKHTFEWLGGHWRNKGGNQKFLESNKNENTNIPEPLGHSKVLRGKLLQLKKKNQSQVPLAHYYNLSYLGDWDQEYHSLRSPHANSSSNPILKTPNTEKGWESGSSGKASALQVWGPKFKPHHHLRKKKSERDLK